MEWLIPSLTKSMRASVRPRHEWWLWSTHKARAEFLQNAVLWKGGVEGFQESTDWCSGVKQGISACFTIREPKCSSLCSGSRQEQYAVVSLQEFPYYTGQIVCWPPWKLPVLDEDQSSGALLMVREYHTDNAFAVASALWNHPLGSDATVLCMGRGRAVSSHVWILPSWDHPWAWIVKAGSANTLLPMLC